MAMAKTKSGARSKSRSRVRSLADKPAVQYVAAFLAAYIAFFIAGFIASLVPVYQWLPFPPNTDSTSPYWVTYNLWVTAAQGLLPSLLFGAGFWLYGRGLMALGVAPIKSVMLWLKALIPAFLFLVLVMSTSLLSSLGLLYLSPNSQVIFDLVTIPLLGFMYVLGWWVVRH